MQTSQSSQGSRADAFHYRYTDLRKLRKKWLKLAVLLNICIYVHTECYPYYFSRKPKFRLPVAPTWHWFVWSVTRARGKHECAGARNSVLSQLGCTHRSVLRASSAKLFHGTTRSNDIEDRAYVGAVCEVSLDLGVSCSLG